MTTQSAVRDFLSQKTLALIGASRSGKGFGNAVLKELKAKGYKVYPVHPQAESLEGERCYSSLTALPEKVGGVVVVVPPNETEKVVKEAKAAGIERIWIQQGAESPEAIRFCEESGMSAVHGECILMFAEPVGTFHKLHRWVWKLLGKLPK
jgi:predicted CoA-binding protein